MSIFNESILSPSPKSVSECNVADPVASSIWKWARIIEIIGLVVFIIDAVAGLIVGLALLGPLHGGSLAFIPAGALLGALFYLLMHLSALFMGALARITQNSFVISNVEMISETQITKCETAIKNDKYNATISLLKKSDINNAYESLIAPNEYKDSAEKAKEIFGKYKTEKLKTASVGDMVYFGAYEQDNNTSNGKEDVEWLVLAKEGDKALVISKYALDCQQYNTSHTDVTWETCSLRKWLNGTFLSAAFSSEEQNSIISSTVTADKNPSYNTSPGNNTTDKVFLLSITEVKKYFSSDEARKCVPTEYAIAQGAGTNVSNGNCWWWLRSPGDLSSNAAYVNYGGSVYCDGYYVNRTYGAVRPALWINLGS